MVTTDRAREEGGASLPAFDVELRREQKRVLEEARERVRQAVACPECGAMVGDRCYRDLVQQTRRLCPARRDLYVQLVNTS